MARLLSIALLLWSTSAMALELPAVAPTLAQDLLSGLKSAGSSPGTLYVQPFVGPTATAGNLDARLKDVFRNQMGLQVLSPKGEPTSNANALVAAAKKAGAQGAITGSLTCETNSCTATGEAYDVTTGQLAIVVTVQFDVKAGGSKRVTSVTAAATLHDLAARLASDLHQVSSQFGYRRFAVAPLAEAGADVSRDGAYGRAVADEVSNILQREYRVSVVAAGEVAGALGGGKHTAAEMSAGQLMSTMASLGAQAFMTGTIDSHDGTSVITVQITSTAVGENLGHEDASLTTTDLKALSAEGDAPPDAIGAFERSLVLPGWGQFYTHQPLKGTLFAVGEVAFIAGIAYFWAAGVQAENHYAGVRDPNQQAMIDHYYGIAKNDYTWRNVFVGLTVGTYVINAIDALFWGPKPDEGL